MSTLADCNEDIQMLSIKIKLNRVTIKSIKKENNAIANTIELLKLKRKELLKV
jgi:hypothetical protein